MELFKEYLNEIPRNTLKEWNQKILEETHWQFCGRSGDGKEPLRHWAAYPAFAGVFKELWDCMNYAFLDEGLVLEPERVIANLYNHGDSSWLHKDSNTPSWTVIAFLNDFWDIQWAGDFVLVQDNEILKSFAPTPGKFLRFRGDILHGARPVSRGAPYPRLGVAFQCADNIQTVEKNQVSRLHSPL